MNPSGILPKLTPIFHEVFDDEDIVLSEKTTAKDVSGWDSLAHIRLLLTIERRFHVKFSAAEISRLKSVGDLAALILAKS